MIIFLKSHPATQAMSRAAAPAELNEPGLRRNPGEPSAEQAEADTYNKPRIEWQGLTIAIENPAGSVRRGRNRHGVTWEVRMRFDYGEVVGSMGVDGDPVDIYMGPNPDAPMVYVVHQRRVNDWTEYDEDKCMVGFDSQADAEAAFLSNYNDPRFLGPVTAMPVDEFVQKVRATAKNPAMIKSVPVMFLKTHVNTYTRKDGTVVAAHEDKRAAHGTHGGADQLRSKDAGRNKPDLREGHQDGALEDVKKQWDAAGIKSSISENGGTIELLRIIVPDVERGAGVGTKAMQALVEYADKTGKRVELTPSSDFGGNKNRLIGFYKRFGFVENKGRNKDFTTMAGMIREPKRAQEGMIKSHTPMVLFFKSHVGPYLRGGKIVNVAGYQGKGARAMPQPGQMSLFGGPESGKPLPPTPLKGKDPVARTPDMFSEHPPEKVAWAKKVIANRDYMPWQDVKEAHNVLGIKDGDAEWASKKMAPAKKNDTVTEPRADLIAEHERLVGVLESPSHADDKVEAKKQAKELGEMKGEGGDVVDPFTLSKNELNKRLDAMVAAGEAYDSIRAFLELRKRYVRATGKPSIPPMGSRAIRINPEDLTG